MFRDETLLKVYRKRGMSESEAYELLAKVRAMPPVDPGITPPCIDNAADDSYDPCSCDWSRENDTQFYSDHGCCEHCFYVG